MLNMNIDYLDNLDIKTNCKTKKVIKEIYRKITQIIKDRKLTIQICKHIERDK